MSKFINSLKRYKNYLFYSTKAELNSEVEESYLGPLWWLLDPFFFMLVYTFIMTVVFGKSEQYLPIFVFIGLSAWNFFNNMMMQSVKLVRTNRGVVTKVYVPKYILILEKMFVLLFKMLIAFGLVLVLMLFYQVPFSWYWVAFFIPITLVLFVLTFGFSCIVMHFGVFVDDLSHVITVLLRLVFYLSGVFFSLTGRMKDHPLMANLLLKLNPVAFLMQQYRNVFIYQTLPDIPLLLIWFVVGIILSIIGIYLIRKYENSYAKVV